jgi:hypothetical protein
MYRTFATFFLARYVPFTLCQFPQKLTFSAVGSEDALSNPCGLICPDDGFVNFTANVGTLLDDDPPFINQIVAPPSFGGLLVITRPSSSASA